MTEAHITPPLITEFSDTEKPEFSEVTIKPRKKTSTPISIRPFLNKEVTVNDCNNASRTGIIWEAWHSLPVNEYIIQSVPSNPPIQHFEIYGLWPLFLYSRLQYKHYPTFKLVTNRFIKWLKEILVDAGTSDLRNTWVLKDKIKKDGIKTYALGMKAYSERENKNISTL